MTAQEFLCKAMDRYAAMATFQAAVDVDESGTPMHRRISYERPNRFRLESSFSNEHLMTSVCDGQRIVEYSNEVDQGARSYAAAPSIWLARSMFTMHPMFCGSPLYAMFGGASSLDQLADLHKKPVEFGASEDIQGEPATSVTRQSSPIWCS